MCRKFLLKVALLLTGLVSACSGLTMQIKYRMARHGQLDATDRGYPVWAWFHKNHLSDAPSGPTFIAELDRKAIKERAGQGG